MPSPRDHPPSPLRVGLDTAPSTDDGGDGGDRFTTWWTPLLGPSASCLYRALRLVATDEAVELSVEVLGAALGFGERRGRLVVPDALDRLRRHRLVRTESGSGIVLMQAGLPPSHLLRRIGPDWLGAVGAHSQA